MTDSVVQEKARTAMVAISAAVRNLQLYPVSSASATGSIDKALQAIQDFHAVDENLIYAESEKRLIICRQPVSETEQKKDQFAAFLGLLLDLGVKNITIRKALEREELIAFLAAVGTARQDKSGNTTLDSALGGKALDNILIDHKVYVSVDHDEHVAKGKASDVDIGATFRPMMSTLDFILDEEKKADVSRTLAASIIRRDDELLAKVITQNVDGGMGRNLFENIVEELDHVRFERLMVRLRKMHKAVLAKGGAGSVVERTNIERTFQNLLQTDLGTALQQRVKERRAKEQARKKVRLAKLRKGITDILNDDDTPFCDKALMEMLPQALARMILQGMKPGQLLLDRLGDALLSPEAEVRHPTAEAVAELIRALPVDKQQETVHRLCYNLTDYAKFETEPGPAYDYILDCLGGLASSRIMNGQLAESNHIIEAFHHVANGKKPGSERNRNAAKHALKRVASDELLELVMAEFRSADPERLKQAIHTLTQLGAAAAGPLLTLLRNCENRFERARIIKVISDIGQPAMPALIRQMEKENPWYYLRNLLVLFSRIGDESQVDTLRRYLNHADPQVQHECLNAIYNIAPNLREDIFIEILPTSGDRMKEDIVRMLGRLKSRKVVPTLVEMLQAERERTESRTKFDEVLCIALGYIGDPSVIPLLEKIAGHNPDVPPSPNDSKGLRNAAAKAVEMIRKSGKRFDPFD